MKGTQGYENRLDSLRKWAQERRNTGDVLTFREVARRYGMRISDVFVLVNHANLSCKTGNKEGDSVIEFEE